MYRGSSKRVRRIKWQDHTPPSFVAFMAAGLAIMVLLISWLMTHPETAHHHAEQVMGASR
jgi:H+/Cl- antiporter ClcA